MKRIKVKNRKRALYFLYASWLVCFLIGYGTGALTNGKADEEPKVVKEYITIEKEAAPKKSNVVSLGDFTATAYCSCSKCCGKSDGITATGTKATAGRTIAADPNVLPYGTKVLIDGNEYIVEDCGGKIKENRIDIYFDTHTEALNYGKRTVEVFKCQSET